MNQKLKFIYIFSFLIFLQMFFMSYLVFVVGETYFQYQLLIVTSFIVLLLYMKGYKNISKGKRSTSLDVGLFLSFTIILYFSSFIALLASILVKDIIPSSISTYSFFSILCEMLITILIFKIFYEKDIKMQYSNFKRNIFVGIVCIILGYFLAINLSSFFGTLAQGIQVGSDTAANQEMIEQTLEYNPFNIPLLLSMVVVSPIIEEFFYRFILIEKVLIGGFGISFPTLDDLLDEGFLVNLRYLLGMLIISVVGGLIFASAHAINANSLIEYFRDILIYLGFSIGISFTYILTRNIFVTIGIHVINNLITTILMILAIIMVS